MKKLNIKDYIKVDFIKYLIVAISSFVVDILLFTIFNAFFSKIISDESIIIATILARIISSLYNYHCNSKFVFLKGNKKMLVKYFELVIIQMITSSLLVYLINKLFIGTYATVIKIIVDALIFIANYIIQKKVVFK